jgi:ornithine lipid ester-linked acyl 2-hydroxylase
MGILGRWIVDNLGRPIADSFNKVMSRYSLIGDPEIFDAGEFGWTAPLAAEWQAIEAELAAYEGGGATIPSIGDISPDHAPIDRQRIWKSLFLYGYGYKVPENCAQFPLTTRLVERVPGLLSAFFSRMEPGAHLYRHRGPTKSFVTAHLGLRVPASPGCRMQVENDQHAWHEGKWLIFDDCRWHEVWNDTADPRTILLLHVRRPERGIGRLAQSLFLWGIDKSAFVQDARRGMAAHGLGTVKA